MIDEIENEEVDWKIDSRKHIHMIIIIKLLHGIARLSIETNYGTIPSMISM